MSKIVTSLNLNKSPQDVENNSFIFAKNIRLLKDKSIAPDFGFSLVTSKVGVIHSENPGEEESYQSSNTIEDRILGCITGLNNTLFIFVRETKGDGFHSWIEDNIYKYYELTDIKEKINCGWTYNGGKIDGYVTTNNTNEEILTICEYQDNVADYKKYPIKHINLSHCSSEDDESIYTQTPNLPITNLKLSGTYSKPIPNGVYQFFIRYRISKRNYTNWLPCSKEVFAGSSEVTDTVQGSIKYIKTDTNSAHSFIFDVEHLFESYESLYKDFQLGFICSNDDTVYAKTWKHFSFDTKNIYFDADLQNINDIDVTELTSSIYGLFNVKNCTYFKNKLFISNYIESDFNSNSVEDTHAKDSNNVDVTLKEISLSDGAEYINGKKLSEPYKVNGEIFPINGETVYKKWDNSYISYLFHNDFIVNKNGTVDNTQNTNTKNEDDEFALKASIYYNYDDDPDVLFVNKGESKLGNFLPFDFNITDGWKPYMVSNNPYLYYLITNKWSDKGNHPFNNYGLQGLWYYPSGGAGNKHKIGEYFDIQDWGFNETEANNYCKEVLDGLIKFSSLCNCNYVTGIFLKDLNGVETKIYGDINPSNLYIPETRKTIYDTSLNTIRNIVYSELLYRGTFYVSGSGKFYYIFNNSNTIYDLSDYKVTYERASVEKRSFDSIDVSGTTGETDLFVDLAKNKYQATIVSRISDVYLDNQFKSAQYTTLLPFVSYDFYIHYGNDKGFYTNGHFIKSASFDNPSGNEKTLIYPSIKVNNLPDGYTNYFISIYKNSKDVIQLFNVREEDPNVQESDKYYIGYSSDLDALLYTIKEDISVYESNPEDNDPNTDDVIKLSSDAKYYGSYSTNPIKLYANPGIVRWKKNGISLRSNSTYWIQIETSSQENNELKQLIKITPYLLPNPDVAFEDYNYMNLPGYFCTLYKPYANTGYFVTGTDIYERDTNDYAKLNRYENILPITFTPQVYIKSGFNLNYLALRENNSINTKIRTYTAGGDNNNKQWFTGLESSTLSTALTLPSMYKDYIRKYFSIVSNETINNFDNTIRSSDINVDETYKLVYTFRAEDAYNIPANRGAIVKLFSINNEIYVHVQNSLFKFNGYNSINSINGDVELKESDVFDTGVEEVFDSGNGYGGIIKKEHSIIMYDSYVFYDNLSNKLFAYSKNTKLTDLSVNIEKILNSTEILDVALAADENNNRFFFNIKSTKYLGKVDEEDYYGKRNICLSYNLLSNSFISIHDFDFDLAYSTRSNVYFQLFYMAYEDSAIYPPPIRPRRPLPNLYTYRHELVKYDNTLFNSYLGFTKPSKLWTIDNGEEKEYLHNYISVENTIDIIYNGNYELIKNINYINWVCSAISNYFGDEVYLAEEHITEKYAGSKIRIYSDETSTELITIVDDSNNAIISNNSSLNDKKSYKYPRYNNGIWSFNYFRDVRTIDEEYNYEYKDKALIYGKYFVLRIIFKNKKFKFENINFNINNYDKV